MFKNILSLHNHVYISISCHFMQKTNFYAFSFLTSSVPLYIKSFGVNSLPFPRYEWWIFFLVHKCASTNIWDSLGYIKKLWVENDKTKWTIRTCWSIEIVYCSLLGNIFLHEQHILTIGCTLCLRYWHSSITQFFFFWATTNFVKN